MLFSGLLPSLWWHPQHLLLGSAGVLGLRFAWMPAAMEFPSTLWIADPVESWHIRQSGPPAALLILWKWVLYLPAGSKLVVYARGSLVLRLPRDVLAGPVLWHSVQSDRLAVIAPELPRFL